MKFGGTSVEDAAAMERVREIVRGRLAKKPIVVGSARAKVATQWGAMGEAAGRGDRESALATARAVRERHYRTASELLGTGLFTRFHAELESDFNTLDELLRGIAAVGEITPRSTDALLSFGERLSSKIVASLFSASGINSALVDSRSCIITDSTHTRAVPLFDEINSRLLAQVQPLVEKGIVPVMGGFIGATLSGTPTTIGTGCSDFSAAILRGGLGAQRVEIWTDVDGMITTDPRLCSQAPRITEISFDEAAQLAYFAAKVLHPATMLPAIQKNIPVHVLNSPNPKSEATRITARAPHSRNAI